MLCPMHQRRPWKEGPTFLLEWTSPWVAAKAHEQTAWEQAGGSARGAWVLGGNSVTIKKWRREIKMLRTHSTKRQGHDFKPGPLAPEQVPRTVALQEEGLQAEWSHFQLPATSLRDPYRRYLRPQDPSREPSLSHPTG